MEKIDRINAEIKKQVAYVIENELNDPRVNAVMISIIDVSTTRDMSFCTIKVSIMAGEQEKKDALEGIVKAKGYIRNQIKGRMKIRMMPELLFQLDDSIDYSMHIESILKTLKKD